MRRLVLCAVVIAGRLAWAASAPAGSGNLLANPSFERVEPPMPTAESVQKGGVIPDDQMLPQTWDLVAQWGATISCPNDPALAHTGARSVHANAAKGQANLRYGPMPVPDTRAWTVRFWARGTGTVMGIAWEFLPTQANRLGEWKFPLSATWQPYEFQLAPTSGVRAWSLDIQNLGPAEFRVDDVAAGYDGLASLPLPPAAALGSDTNTLLYLPFEEPLDEYKFFVKGQVHLSAAKAGRFGKSLVMGPEGYVACSANENLDPQQGTIEVWCRFMAPGNNGLGQNIVGVPGPDGMWLGKDQYSHVHFGFSSGWGRISGATAMGYAFRWQPGVWRYFVACWDKDLLEVFVDGKLIGWQAKPTLSRALGPELGLGAPGMELDDLRISKTVRYRVPVAADKK